MPTSSANGAARVIFFDNVEQRNPAWTADPPWAISSEARHSLRQAWSDSPGDYQNNSLATLYVPQFSLSAAQRPIFSFWHKFAFQQGRDFGRVWVWQGGSYRLAAEFTGTRDDWHREEIDLSEIAGLGSSWVAFQIVSDASVTADGWHIDDVAVGDRGAGEPDLVVTPDFLQFEPAAIGKSRSAKVTLSNQGSGLLKIDDVTFVVTQGGKLQRKTMTDRCIGRILAPQQSCRIPIRFKPKTAGLHAGTLTILSNDPVEQIRPTLVFGTTPP